MRASDLRELRTAADMQGLSQEFAALLDELDALHAALTDAYAAGRADQREEDAAEIEALRKDAERYRWLRTHERADVRIVGVGKRMGHDLSAAIDAARETK